MKKKKRKNKTKAKSKARTNRRKTRSANRKTRKNKKEVKKEIKILVALFIIAFIIRFVFVFSTPVKIWDETIYANLGYDLSQNPFDYSVEHNGWSDFIPSHDSNYAWPKMGFRAPLLPYFLSILYLLGLDFFVNFFIVLVGALSVVLVYFLGKKLFNKKAGFYSAILFSVIPLHVVYSAKILTGVLFTFFVLLTFLSFWIGYEEGKNKYKVLFGVFLALALLSRYTALWIMPVFLIYFLIRDRSFEFLKDKYLWYAVVAFFAVLSPWLAYGSFEYGNPIGAFVHGAKGSSYWGGIQSWYFFFRFWSHMFSFTGYVFVAGLIYILWKKDFLKKEIYFLLAWFAVFLGLAIYMPHKEDRFVLAITPVIALVSGYAINKLSRLRIERIERIGKLLLLGIVIASLFSLNSQFNFTYDNSYTVTNNCFLEANKFLEKQEKSIVITDESPLVYFYTRHETHFYPNPWKYSALRKMFDEHYNHYSEENQFVLFASYDMPLNDEEHVKIKEDLDENLARVFECGGDESFAFVYSRA